MQTNWKKIYAIKQKNKERILQVCPTVTENSGIYFLTRVDENGEMFAYVGQSHTLLSRLADHLSGYQWIDLSIKKHGFFSPKNVYGWSIFFCEYPVEMLDEKEREYINFCHEKGYTLRNKTSGGQNEGKEKIAEWKPAKGYRDGLAQGEKNAKKFVKNLFEKHLNYNIKSQKPNKTQEKMKAKFEEWLNESNTDSSNTKPD